MKGNSNMSEHLTAEELILRAARNAGLTKEVAAALWFIDKHELGNVALSVLLDELAGPRQPYLHAQHRSPEPLR
jgi:hypothetical protein